MGEYKTQSQATVEFATGGGRLLRLDVSASTQQNSTVPLSTTTLVNYL